MEHKGAGVMVLATDDVGAPWWRTSGGIRGVTSNRLMRGVSCIGYGTTGYAEVRVKCV